MRILILEDEPLTALDLQMAVEAAGHEIADVCHTLRDANRWLSGDIDLDFAFLDIDLPDGKSFAVATAFDARRVPFAFVSASKQGEVPANLRHALFISKPYGHAAIRNSLDTAGRLAC